MGHINLWFGWNKNKKLFRFWLNEFFKIKFTHNCNVLLERFHWVSRRWKSMRSVSTQRTPNAELCNYFLSKIVWWLRNQSKIRTKKKNNIQQQKQINIPRRFYWANTFWFVWTSCRSTSIRRLLFRLIFFFFKYFMHCFTHNFMMTDSIHSLSNQFSNFSATKLWFWTCLCDK